MKWRFYATREFPRVERELGIPCAMPVRVTGMVACPRHQEPLGKTSRICVRCHHEAWDEAGRRYAAQGRPVEPERRVSTFPGPNRKPLPGQLSLLGDEITNEEEMIMTTTSTERTERELLPAVIEPAMPITLFGTSDPRVALERMADVATALVDVIEQKKLFSTIGRSRSRHINVEGWTCLGGMLGVHAIVTETRPNDTGDGIVAHAEARLLDGRVVGAADGECSRAEGHWKNSEPYAIRSMAQTRAISRALRGPLGQIVALAGYEPAGAEEMPVIDAKPGDDGSSPSETEPWRDKITAEYKPTDAQVAELRHLLAELATAQPDVDWTARAREIAGVPGEMLNVTTMGVLLDKLGQEFEALEPAA